ncbi:hypothetical protein [Paenibacillus soyae]|uniref:Uncharacterized protein n=1 Tax=Paenibacillus soyae TaxID=2969249 RepID=A0A9X2MPS3_9BACL|nr:hypothetical protein [Paenibacillus soyae]MCR2804624.1 hypothetical protein [Paenibacillus soyae]
MFRKEALFFLLILIGLLLISNSHLGYSFGDSVFRAIGISPWTQGDDSGLHISVIAGFLALAAGYMGAVKFYQARFPKIRSRIILSCIAFVLLFPIVTENAMILRHYHSYSFSSVAFSEKNSQCSYQSEGASVKANCTLTLINYGQEKVLTIRPYPIQSPMKLKLDPILITLPAHQKLSISTDFDGRLLEEASLSGWSNDIGIEIEFSGVKKKYGKEIDYEWTAG